MCVEEPLSSFSFFKEEEEEDNKLSELPPPAAAKEQQHGERKFPGGSKQQPTLAHIYTIATLPYCVAINSLLPNQRVLEKLFIIFLTSYRSATDGTRNEPQRLCCWALGRRPTED